MKKKTTIILLSGLIFTSIFIIGIKETFSAMGLEGTPAENVKPPVSYVAPILTIDSSLKAYVLENGVKKPIPQQGVAAPATIVFEGSISENHSDYYVADKSFTYGGDWSGSNFASGGSKTFTKCVVDLPPDIISLYKELKNTSSSGESGEELTCPSCPSDYPIKTGESIYNKPYYLDGKLVAYGDCCNVQCAKSNTLARTFSLSQTKVFDTPGTYTATIWGRSSRASDSTSSSNVTFKVVAPPLAANLFYIAEGVSLIKGTSDNPVKLYIYAKDTNLKTTANFLGSLSSESADVNVKSADFSNPEWATTTNKGFQGFNLSASESFGKGSYGREISGTDKNGASASDSVFVVVDKKTYSLDVVKSGAGSGSVSSSPSGINCGTDCSESYDDGAFVTLTAAPSSDSVFYSWLGDCVSSRSSCSLTINSNKSVTAVFGKKPPSCSTFSANPATIPTYSKSTLKWSCQYADSCDIYDGEDKIASGTSGDKEVSLKTISKTYKLVCLGQGGSGEFSATVKVFPIQYREVSPY